MKNKISSVDSKLYKHDLYTTDDYDYIISKRITEYDIKSAGINLCKYYRLLPKEKLKYLDTLDKNSQKIQIGKYMKSDKEFNKNHTKSFRWIRKEFFKSNNICDSDIISIKKDAIFIVSKKCKTCSFENVEFVEKNVYTSYHRFGNIELYYNSRLDKLDVKGINNDLLYQHISFMNILKRIFKLLEENKHDEFIKFMKRFTDDYKNKRLSYKYYREFNSGSNFILNNNESKQNYVFGVNSMNDSLDDKLDISYNYMNYILPIIQRFYFKDIRKIK